MESEAGKDANEFILHIIHTFWMPIIITVPRLELTMCARSLSHLFACFALSPHFKLPEKMSGQILRRRRAAFHSFRVYVRVRLLFEHLLQQQVRFAALMIAKERFALC
jgi:hypothetical protein